MRRIFYGFAFLSSVFLLLSLLYFPNLAWSGLILVPIIALGIRDTLQTRHSILRNFPILGHLRYMLEAIRPEINQYFIESNKDGRPFSREQRSLIYQRAKKELDTLPFGTQEDVYQVGYEWMAHSMSPVVVEEKDLRIKLGGPQCTRPYSASIFNISAMSYGSLSSNAIVALNGGAKDGHFAHNTGEGGLSPYHLQEGGDLIWELGTAYFSARDRKGNFCADSFREKAVIEQIKMIEIKINQGAKPGHGGILPKEKLNAEIAKIRGVPMGEDVISPPGHTAFSTPIELMEFVQELRELSGGKPVGIKLCIGKRWEFVAVCKAMMETGIYPDYFAVDGGEGGTGAAPLEFSNRVGFPSVEGQLFVHNTLNGFAIRDKVKIIGIGKITTAFDIAKKIALGADATYAARSFMMALGCIQALRCNSNTCPTGVATQKPELVKGLVVADKRTRVKNFHHETILSLSHLMSAIGAKTIKEITPNSILRRASPQRVYHYGELYEYIPVGSLLDKNVPESFRDMVKWANTHSFKKSA